MRQRGRQSELVHGLVNRMKGRELHPNSSAGTGCNVLRSQVRDNTKVIAIMMTVIMISIDGNCIERKGNFPH